MISKKVHKILLKNVFFTVVRFCNHLVNDDGYVHMPTSHFPFCTIPPGRFLGRPLRPTSTAVHHSHFPTSEQKNTNFIKNKKINSDMNPIDRQSSLKLKDRWISSFQKELLVDKSSNNEQPEGFRPDPIDLENNADGEKDKSSNEFRDRVPSVGELQQQLEELMKALIDLQMSR